MIITLDGRRLTDVPSADHLQDLLEQIRSTALGDRLIVSVAVDGQVLDDEQLRTRLGAPLPAEIRQLDLRSADRRTLVADALRGLALEFGQAAEGQGDLAEQFGTGALGPALRGIGDFIGLWQTAQRALAQCSELLGTDLTLWEHAGRPVRAWLRELIDKLNELRAALDARDLVLLADLLRYELLPLCGTWQVLFDDLAAQCPARLTNAAPPVAAPTAAASAGPAPTSAD